jgi:hypothetical protein
MDGGIRQLPDRRHHVGDEEIPVMILLSLILVLALAAVVLVPIYADMLTTEPGSCVAARGLDL